jgi:hydroxyacylglutathione hydrolase
MRIPSTLSRFPRSHVAILAAALLFAACDRSAEPDTMTDATPDQPTAPAPAAPPKLTPAQLAQASARADFFFLDVRSPEEIGELGTLPGYVNIPIEELEGRLAEIPPGMAIVTA